MTITTRNSKKLSLSAYRQAVIRYRTAYDPNLRFHMYTYHIQITVPTVRKAALSLLRNELKAFIHEDRIHSATSVFSSHLSRGYPVEGILKNLVKAAIVAGSERAAKAFYASWACGYISYHHYSLLTGIRVEE